MCVGKCALNVERCPCSFRGIRLAQEIVKLVQEPQRLGPAHFRKQLNDC